MSKVSSKLGRDQALKFQGFLNDLQDWELSLRDKDKKLKPQDTHKGKSLGLVSEERQLVKDSSNSASQYMSPMNFDAMSSMPSSFMTGGSIVDATSEKDLGNEYFKQKKFNEAIDCYSRSIALSPTAVAYANRAMAYLKIKRFQEAEDDCTEALNLDDRYIKAYSRRATARKGIGKLRDSLEDVEFALRLEPQNEELKKQRADTKSLLEKAILAKAAGTAKRPAQVVKEVESKVDANKLEKVVQYVPDKSKTAGVDVLPGKTQVSGDPGNKNKMSEMKGKQQVNDSQKAAPNGSYLKISKTSKKEVGSLVQELASRAASRAMDEAAKNISPPNSAYQFEVCWRGFCGDRSLQARYLKVTPPDALPQIFKNALSAPLLIDVVKCVASLFMEETELAVKYLEYLTKIPRFDMIIMCLPSADKADLCRTWDEVFLSKATPIEYAELLNDLRPRYYRR